MHNEKIIKKLLSKSKSNILISKLFDEFTNPKLDLTDDDAISDVQDYFINHYKSVDAEIRLEIVNAISSINKLLNDEGLNIINNLKSKIENSDDVIAESLGDKVIAFYLNNKDKWQQAVDLGEFYSVSNYTRYEGGGKITNIDLDEVKLKIVESLKAKIEDLGLMLDFVLDVYKYDDSIFVKVSYTNNTSTYFMYRGTSKDIIIKNSFKSLKTFDLASLITLKINNYIIEEKFLAYDLSLFNNKDPKGPLFDNPQITSWELKGIKFKKEKDEVSFNFKLEDDIKYMQKYFNIANKFDLVSNAYEISQISIVFKVTNSKKFTNITIKSTKSNLNILKKDHIVIENLLKTKNIQLDWKIKEL